MLTAADVMRGRRNHLLRYNLDQLCTVVASTLRWPYVVARCRAQLGLYGCAALRIRMHAYCTYVYVRMHVRSSIRRKQDLDVDVDACARARGAIANAHSSALCTYDIISYAGSTVQI